MVIPVEIVRRSEARAASNIQPQQLDHLATAGTSRQHHGNQRINPHDRLTISRPPKPPTPAVRAREIGRRELAVAFWCIGMANGGIVRRGRHCVLRRRIRTARRRLLSWIPPSRCEATGDQLVVLNSSLRRVREQSCRSRRDEVDCVLQRRYPQISQQHGRGLTMAHILRNHSRRLVQKSLE